MKALKMIFYNPWFPLYYPHANYSANGKCKLHALYRLFAYEHTIFPFDSTKEKQQEEA